MADPTDLILQDPGILGGTPVFRGTRVPIQTMFEHLEAGETLDAFLGDFPTVARDVAVAVLEELRQLQQSRLPPPRKGEYGLEG